MFNPLLILHEPVERIHDQDAEQFGQRHGRLVRNGSIWTRMEVRLGRLFLRMGEALTREDPERGRLGEDACLEFSKEIA